MSSKSKFSVKLFYSYSHKDILYREQMELSLALLRDQDGILDDWSDHKILPGQKISERIEERMRESDIFVFLLSKEFIASGECRKEWKFACELAKKKPSIHLVPIILSDCSWKDLNGMSGLKALPDDATPVKEFPNEDVAWNQIYNGIKILIEHLKSTFTVKTDFREEIEKTEFISQGHINIQDIFVFPNLSQVLTSDDETKSEINIESEGQLLDNKYMLIYGDELSGKTALCRYLFLSLIDDRQLVLFVDLEEMGRKPGSDVFREIYSKEFNGDYSLWKDHTSKIIILDNLSEAPGSIELVQFAAEQFQQVIVTLSSDTFHAYFRDDDRLKNFSQVKILPFTHTKQEELIKKRFAISSVTNLDGHVDQLENQVNDVIINNRILPRYPFYILTIIQTFEGFMPSDLSITSYGHCYYVLIFAHLVKSGISKADDEINACFNFMEHLAFEIYQSGSSRQCLSVDEFNEFVRRYEDIYYVKKSIMRRLCDQEFGIIRQTSQFDETPVYQFKSPYMYYYFVGKYLAGKRNKNKHSALLESIVEKSFITTNRLILIFIIHHTNDDEVIDDILLQTICAIDETEPSILDRDEAKIFEDIVAALPSDVLSDESVEFERKKERERRDWIELKDRDEFENEHDEDSHQRANEVYRIMKNSEILGQILRNKYGSLERVRTLEIIETIADGGLRLVRLILGSQDEMYNFALFIQERESDIQPDKLLRFLRLLSFVWTIMNIENIVKALNKPEIRPLVKEVVRKKKTPAYDLIEFFLRLDTISKFTEKDKEKLETLWKKHDFEFFRKVISLRTQQFLNTHQVRTPVEQAVCSILGIKYRPRLK